MFISSAWVPILTTMLGVSAVLVATRLRCGDLLSPFSTSVLMLTAIFGVRPLFMIASDSYNFHGLDITSGFDEAALIGLCGISALSLGYLLGRAGPVEPPPEPAPVARHADRLWPTAVMAGLVLLSWLLVTAFIGGGLAFVAETFDGRSADVSAAFVGVPGVVSALPVVAGVLIAVKRISIERSRRLRPRETLCYWLFIVLAVIPPSALGTRRYLIPTLIAALLGACARKWTRQISPRMVLSAVVLTLALAIVPFVRSAGSRIGGSTDFLGAMADRLGESGVSGVISDFFLSYDTEMFSYVAYVAPRLGTDFSAIPYGFGRGTLVELVIAPLPASLLPVRSWSNTLLDSIFGAGCTEGVCPVPSAFGTLFFDLAYPGLIVGGVLFGLLFARFGARFLQASGSRLTALVVLAAFAPLMARGNMISQLWIATQVFVVLVAAGYIVRVVSRSIVPPHRLANGNPQVALKR